jgi:hypothetical protein
MKTSLQIRRQKLLRELNGIDRQILEAQKSIAQLENKIGSLQSRPQTKAA